MTNLKLTFLGNEFLSSAPGYQETPLLLTLLDMGYEIEALIIKKKPSLSRQPRTLAIVKAAQDHHLNLIEIQSKAELKNELANLKSQLAILASFGLMIEPSVIEHFPLGILNIHPSLLPLYRGTTPIETALLNGEAQTGVSLMALNANLDQGDIYAQASLTIKQNEGKLSLTKRLAELGSQLLKTHLPSILNQSLAPQVQDDEQATFTQPIRSQPPHDFKAKGAREWERHIRAYAHCANNKFCLEGTIVEIIEAEVKKLAPQNQMFYNKKEGYLFVACRQDYLAIKTLKPAHHRLMSASDFINGLARHIPKV